MSWTQQRHRLAVGYSSIEPSEQVRTSEEHRRAADCGQIEVGIGWVAIHYKTSLCIDLILFQLIISLRALQDSAKFVPNICIFQSKRYAFFIIVTKCQIFGIVWLICRIYY